jgi:hypothetical protein
VSAVRDDDDALLRVVLPVTLREEIVVVASVEVPKTSKFPDVVAFPCPSTKKLRFSVHADPFQ